MTSLSISEMIAHKVFIFRGKRVLLANDLAELYGVTTKRLNEQVRRNISRFPESFMFQLNDIETDTLSRSQIATLKQGQNIKYKPLVFSEYGALMVSSILNSDQAISVSIQIIETFIKLRESFTTHDEFRQKLLEHDSQIRTLFDAIDQLMSPAESPVKKIGFR